MNDIFSIKITRQFWIMDNGLDDPSDRCSHGEVIVKIGSEFLDPTPSNICTSTASLFLLRSLERDCGFEEFDNLMMPCCGHSMYAVEDGEFDFDVVIPGCPSGLDWTLAHLGNTVRLTLKSGQTFNVSFENYRQTVISFSNEVMRFYGPPGEKDVSGLTEQDLLGTIRYWDEWQSLFAKWSKSEWPQHKSVPND